MDKRGSNDTVHYFSDTCDDFMDALGVTIGVWCSSNSSNSSSSIVIIVVVMIVVV